MRSEKKTALYGLVCGPFTLASHLRGTNIFTDMYDDPDYVKRLLSFTAAVAKTYADYYIEAGMDIIGAVDPLISQISPDSFKEFMSEPYADFFTHVRSKGTFSSFLRLRRRNKKSRSNECNSAGLPVDRTRT